MRENKKDVPLQVTSTRVAGTEGNCLLLNFNKRVTSGQALDIQRKVNGYLLTRVVKRPKDTPQFRGALGDDDADSD